MNRWYLLLLPLLLAPSSGIVTADAEESRPVMIDAEAAAAMGKANNAFALGLYEALKDGQGNLFFSPYSIRAALLMAREGASGETAAQIDRVLRLDGPKLQGAARGKAHRALRDSLRPESFEVGSGKHKTIRQTYELNIANAAWAPYGYRVKDTFLSSLRNIDARLRRVDLHDPQMASKVINLWAARKTHNKIRKIISPQQIPAFTRLILTNAVYFKAAWQDEFSKSSTKPEIFYGPGGKQSRVPLMWKRDRYGYVEKAGAQILWLPYIMGDCGLAVFLPRAKDGLADLETKFCAGTFEGWWKSLKVVTVDVKVPRFKFTSQFDLRKSLTEMGMGSAFDVAKAELTRFSDEKGIFLGGVLHKAFVSVDEEGTEAAAVTALLACGSSLPGTPENPIIVRADHPFLFLITHRETGAILFAGRVTNPR